MKIFLGYPSEHLQRAQDVYVFLTSLGLDVWFDKANVVGGDDFRLEREQAQKHADQIHYLFSKEILERAGEIQRELKVALDISQAQPTGSVYFVPLRVEEVDLPGEFNRLHYIDIFKPDWKLNLCLSIRKRYEQKKENAPDLPLKFHPVAIRASAEDTPFGAMRATGQRA